jgi:hypothetical protein
VQTSWLRSLFSRTRYSEFYIQYVKWTQLLRYCIQPFVLPPINEIILTGQETNIWRDGKHQSNTSTSLSCHHFCIEQCSQHAYIRAVHSELANICDINSNMRYWDFTWNVAFTATLYTTLRLPYVVFSSDMFSFMWMVVLYHLAAYCSLLPATFQDLRLGIIFTFSSKMETIENMNWIL